MALARLDIIRRQRDPRLREAVRLSAEGKVGEALAALEEQNRVREIAAIDDRYRAIANEYVCAVHAGERVLVVSPGNDERRRLNAEIRDALLRNQHVNQDSVVQSVLVGRTLTRAQRGLAPSYEEGDVLKFIRGSKAFGLGKGSYARVLAVDSEHNLLTVAKEDRTVVRYTPSRLQGVEIFHQEERPLAAGDRVQFRAPQRELGVANGEFATVVSIGEHDAELKFGDGRKINARRQQLRHLDYGYASTSHSSQGATVDRVIVDIDTNCSAELVNRKQFYVSISRARFNLTLYTDDRHALRAAVSRTREKSVALEHVRIDLSRPLKHIPEPEHRIIGRGF